MKLSTLFFLSLFFLTHLLSAQTDDYCPCMDPPRYFDESFLDSLLAFQKEQPFLYTISEEQIPQAILITDDFYSEGTENNIPVFLDKPINISPSDLLPKVNVSPSKEETILEEKEASEEGGKRIKKSRIKQKLKKKRVKIKRRKKAKKYKGNCPSFRDEV